MKKPSIVALSIAAAAISLSAVGAQGEERVVELKGGGKIIVQKDGKTFHADSAGKRVRMKDGTVMQGKDGQKYLMKNDTLWNQVTEKGTLAPNR